MYRGVLVTLDGSPLSETVLAVVGDLVAGSEAVVTLLTVGEVPGATLEMPRETVQPYIYLTGGPAVRLPSSLPKYAETKGQAIDRTEEMLQRYLESKAEALRERGVEVRTAVDFGDAAERIIEHADRPETDIVVMATHGHTGLRSVIFGSVAGQVLRSGVRPVTLIRPQGGAPGWSEEAERERAKLIRPEGEA